MRRAWLILVILSCLVVSLSSLGCSLHTAPAVNTTNATLDNASTTPVDAPNKTLPRPGWAPSGTNVTSLAKYMLTPVDVNATMTGDGARVNALADAAWGRVFTRNGTTVYLQEILTRFNSTEGARKMFDAKSLAIRSSRNNIKPGAVVETPISCAPVGQDRIAFSEKNNVGVVVLQSNRLIELVFMHASPTGNSTGEEIDGIARAAVERLSTPIVPVAASIGNTTGNAAGNVTGNIIGNIAGNTTGKNGTIRAPIRNITRG